MAHQIKMMKLTELEEARHPRNPKRHDVANLADSIARFGFAAPVLLCERTGLIAAGHGRVEALGYLKAQDADPPSGISASKDGAWSVPAVRGWSSVDDDELIAYIVADNRQNELGGWDSRVLADILDGLSEEGGVGLLGVGYADVDVEQMLAALNPVAPAAFKNIDPDAMDTEFKCPSCSYEWSGQPKPGEPVHEPSTAA